MVQDRITALYARVSTEEQAREGQSIENQIDRLTAYAKFQGWQNVQVFADYGESAKNMDRPEMQRLLKLIKRKKVAVVATMAVDRLSRDLLDMLHSSSCARNMGRLTFVRHSILIPAPPSAVWCFRFWRRLRSLSGR